EGAEKVGGATGTLIQAYEPGVRAFLRFFLLDGNRPGALLPGGVGVLVRAGEIHETQQVDWLSGCNMAYRRQVFNDLRFDQGLGSYGWGEDRDFSVRVARQWRLLATPDARLVHLKEPSGRIDERRMGFMETNYLYRFFAKNMPRRLSNWLVLAWNLVGVLTRNLLLVARGGTRAAALRRLQGNLVGLAAIVTGKDYSP
ncbi:MAG: glycosyltransferase family 2 protein, partial [Caldilineaceae bacterium]